MRYERLGFSFVPLTVPRIRLRPDGEPELFGAGNRTAVFTHNYLEVLAIVDVARWAEVTPEQKGPYDLDRPLSRYEGLHVMHFGADDIGAVHERLVAEGVPTRGVHPYQRTVDTVDGPKPMRALAMGFPPEANPEALVQMAQHLTPELIFQERYQHHDNGATDVVEITVCGENPQRYAALYTSYTGHKDTGNGDVWTVDLGRSRVRVVSPDALAALIPGGQAAPPCRSPKPDSTPHPGRASSPISVRRCQVRFRRRTGCTGRPWRFSRGFSPWSVIWADISLRRNDGRW